MPYEIPELPYPYDALEAAIDEQTMRLHHEKHHQAYVDKANDALGDTEWADRPIEEALWQIESLPKDRQTLFRNNGGGHANHSLLWEIMSPDGGGDPEGALGEALDETFRSLPSFKERFRQAAIGIFGSGWTWLVFTGNELRIEQTPNQDSPYMQGLVPLLGLDVWEHAYYLRYQNRRPDYIEAWWRVVNWPEVARRYEQASEAGMRSGLAGRVRDAVSR